MPAPRRDPRSAPDLLAVLGRGIQRVDGRWTPTSYLEVYNGRRHSATPLRGGDEHPQCRVGGSQINIDAAVEVLKRAPIPCVLAYCPRAKYLRVIDGPSENAVMTQALLKRLPDAEVIRWTERDRGPSDTLIEIRDVVQLARQRGFRHVLFLTILAHVPRVLLLAEREIPSPIRFTVASSETVLLAHRPKLYRRISKLMASRAFVRSVNLEILGVNRLLAGSYG